MRSFATTLWPVVLLAVAAIVTGAGWKWWESLRLRRAMIGVEEDMANGLYGLAVRNLAGVLADHPDLDEAHFLLGSCEMARGRTEAATAAWARVRPDSPFAPRAIIGHVQVEMERGRLSEAERIIKDALADPRIDPSSLPILLGPIYCQQGRVDETLRLLEVRWRALNQLGEGASEPAINLVRAHVALLQSPALPDAVHLALDQMTRMAPDDDRILLGKANLAIREGSYHEARRWLEDCKRRRPDDVAVWHAWLDWAVATNQVDEARACLSHLPADELTPSQCRRLAAWFAAQRGDAQAERRELERAIATDPTDFKDRDRLVALLSAAGLADKAAELRSSRSDVERRLARFRKLYERNQPRRDAVEMARLAEQLGQPFEAEGFLTLALALEPEREDLRQSLDRVKQYREAIKPPIGVP